MPLTLAEIASRLGGRVAGDADTLIRQVGSLEHAGAGQITFLANRRYKAKLAGTHASAVVLAPEAEKLTALPRIVTERPYAYFAKLSRLLNPDPAPVPGVHASAIVAGSAAIAASARIDAGASVEAHAVVGERAWVGAGCHLGAAAVLGEDVRLHPSVMVLAGCRIGARSVLHSGAVIGADGFGIAEEEGRWIKIPQIGRVLIGEDVEIGANTTIDRGAIDDTVIEDGVKLDNQIQIGHNVRVGAHTAMAGCVAVAGSADIGRHCTIGAASLILGHLRIVDGVQVSAGTVISRSILKPGTYTGMFPFDDNASWARNTALVRHLAEMAERLRALEQRAARPRKGKKHG
jgi:UDP-3-O-[3-hydroxymyristoyl] glucosamine N-acyltransferase